MAKTKEVEVAEKKPWYKSQTKLGAVLVGLAPICVIVGGILLGDIDPLTGITQLAIPVGAILGVFGLRDLPVVNGK